MRQKIKDPESSVLVISIFLLCRLSDAGKRWNLALFLLPMYKTYVFILQGLIPFKNIVEEFESTFRRKSRQRKILLDSFLRLVEVFCPQLTLSAPRK